MPTDISQWVQALRFKDHNIAYKHLKLLLAESQSSPEVYGYFDDFVEMLNDKNSYIRTRGLMLISENAKWDTEGRIDEIIDDYLDHITDEKPITARQCIKALPNIAGHRPGLAPKIKAALENADISKYADTMRPLILKDIMYALGEMA